MASTYQKFGFKRKSGILLPISSLPSPYGIGSLGKSAYDFVDFLKECGTKCWQVLPLNPTSYGDSPYQSPASAAGNPYFIDLDILYKKGLLTKEDLRASKYSHNRIDYGWLFHTRYTVLRKAHAAFLDSKEDKSSAYKSFKRKCSDWLDDYALFMSLKVSYNFDAWTSWNDEHKNIKSAREHKENFKDEMSFWCWVQYEFYTQWQALLLYAHSLGITVVGDMPIYVAHDSMDVWQSPEQFLLDERYNPTVVAGCPPDGFSPDGQLWGNPIYNWELMENEGFTWWKKRVKAALSLYDILRIDHFRGFAGYYSIPYGEPTARNGKWNTAPGIELFCSIKSAFPKAKIIAEDLGHITPDVRELLTQTGFPGMKILQFAMFNDDSEYLPRMFGTDNCVAYTGSHDSECTRSWCASLKGDNLKRFKKECPQKDGENKTVASIRAILESPANLAIIPMQDYLELKNEDGRINTPSIAEGNWTYRLSKRYNSLTLINKIKTLNILSKRYFE